MIRRGILLLSMVLAVGCTRLGVMDHPEDPQGRYHDQIAAAQRLLEQETTWADRAEWEVKKSGDGWKVTAWRVVHPDRKGAERYMPWGYMVINLDSRLVTVSFRAGG